jgi:hypothetical protein
VSTIRGAGALLIAGSVIFLLGAQLGVPKVFTEPEPQSRLRMLEENLGRWRAAQPLYGLGPIITAVGAALLAADAPAGGGTRAMFWLAAAALLAGSLAWARSVYLRAIRVADFAFARLPGWPFAIYVLLTIGGLAALGIGLLTSGIAAWLVALTLAADVLFFVLYAKFGDIPPFVFYVLLLIVGLVLVATPDALGS